MPQSGLGLQGLQEDKNVEIKSNITPTPFLYLNIYVTKKY